MWNLLKASSDKGELATLNARVDRMVGDLGLTGIATVLGNLADLKGILVSFELDLSGKEGAFRSTTACNAILSR